MLKKDYGDNALNIDSNFWTPTYKLTTAFVGSVLEYEKGDLSVPAYYAIRVNTVPPSVFESKEGNLKSYFTTLNAKKWRFL